FAGLIASNPFAFFLREGKLTMRFFNEPLIEAPLPANGAVGSEASCCIEPGYIKCEVSNAVDACIFSSLKPKMFVCIAEFQGKIVRVCTHSYCRIQQSIEMVVSEKLFCNSDRELVFVF